MAKGFLALSGVYYVWKIILTIVVFVIIMVLIKAYVQTDTDVIQTEIDLYSYRLLYGSEGVSYYDSEQERMYPGIIDLSKVRSDGFTEQLGRHLDFGEQRHIAIKVEFFDMKGDLLVEAYNDELLFTRLYPPSFSGTGPGGVHRLNKRYYVLYKDKREFDIWEIDDFISMYDPGDFENQEIIDREEEEKLKLQAQPRTYEDSQLVPGILEVTLLKQNS